METNVYYEGQLKYLEAQEQRYLTPKDQTILMQFNKKNNSYVFLLDNHDTKVQIWSDSLKDACTKAKAFSLALRIQSLQ